MSAALTFAKFVEFLKRSTVRRDMHFIFQPKDMVNLCLNLNESQPIYAYKCYAYKKSVLTFLAKANQFGSSISFAYFAVKQNANLFVHEKQTKLSPRTLKCTFRKKTFVEKNEKCKERIFSIVC